MRAEICCLVAVALLVAGTQLCWAGLLRYCYFHSTLYNSSTGPPFQVKDIDVRLCTHFIYAHARIDSAGQTIKAAMPSVEEGPAGMYREFVDSITHDPSVRAMLSLGGPLETSQAFEAITATEAALDTFAGRAARFLRDRSFEGVVIDWQFPDTDVRRRRLTMLLIALRRAFHELNGTIHLLTVSGPGLATQVDAGFDVPQIAIHVDYVLVRTYSLVQPNSRHATFNSPLYNNPTSVLDHTLNVNYSVHHWIKQGLPTAKLVVGLTGQGSYFKLANRAEFQPGSPVTSEVQRGEYYNVTCGMMYPQICKALKNNLSSRHFDHFQGNPYFVNGDMWVGYEDAESLKLKLQWMDNLGVAGFTFAGLHEDDFTGELCLEGRYPLLTSIYNSIFGMLSVPDETTPAMDTTSHDFRPSKGSESHTVLAYMGFVFILAGSVIVYGLYVFLSKERFLPSVSE